MMKKNIAIVLMGVSGAGKSTIGVRLARKLDRNFLEGDTFHPAANVEKMSRGVPLDDDDRRPWLMAIADAIEAARRSGRKVIVTCSALKRSYRTILAAGHDDVAFVFLKGSQDLIAQRLAGRAGHFMPPKLLESQFAALEEPGAGEGSIVMTIDHTPDQIVDAIAATFVADAQA